MSKVHKGSNKKIKKDSNVTALPSGRSFFADKKERPERCKKVVRILGKRVIYKDLLLKGFYSGKEKGGDYEIKEYASDVG